MRAKAMLLACGCAILAASAAIAAMTPADVVRARIDGYREMGAAFKAVNDALRGDELQAVLLAQSAREIRNAARRQYGWFPAGSDASTGVKTAVRPDIWSKPAQFKAVQDSFSRQAEAFQKVLAGGNLAAIRSEARKLGQTCKSCHDAFRAEKN